MTYALEFDHVSKLYAKKYAVEQLTLSIKKGEFISLLGSSGSGKSTSLMMLAGFVQPDSGRILIDGRDVTSIPPNQRNIGMVYQNYALFPHMTIAENVAFPLKMRKVSKAEAETRVKRALDLVKLADFMDRVPARLSGGQQQRVALARALVFEPSILLMDEPLGALDKNLRDEMKAEIKSIHRRLGTTTMYVTHDQVEALSMSDLVVVMDRGRVEQCASPDELYNAPANGFVARFVGGANVFDGLFVGDGATAHLVTLAGNKLAVDAKWLSGNPKSSKAVALRPERIAMGSPDNSMISGTVETILYEGPMIRYIVEAGEDRIHVLRVNRGHAETREGDLVGLSWSLADALVLGNA